MGERKQHRGHLMIRFLLILGFTSSLLFSQVEQDEFLDPMDLNMPKVLDIKKPELEETKEIKFSTNIDDVDLESEYVTRQGYRIQLTSTQDVSMAEAAETKAIEIFGDEVFMVFEYPNYKIRVGNYLNIKDTRHIEIRARRNGFPRAWTVPSEVRVKNTNERY